jgi:hypothetical protein
VTAFTEAGGTAHWDFIVFEHNQHQVAQADALSKQLKFQTFNVKKTSRFFSKDHKLNSSLTVLNDSGYPIYKIKPATDHHYINQQYEVLDSIDKSAYTSNAKIKCHNLHKNEIYIGADGYVFPCGWLHDRLYGIESACTDDRQTIFDMMEIAGGQNMANCFNVPLNQIIDGKWFELIQSTWQNNKLERCVWICGDKINFIQEQNQMVNYDF